MSALTNQLKSYSVCTGGSEDFYKDQIEKEMSFLLHFIRKCPITLKIDMFYLINKYFLYICRCAFNLRNCLSKFTLRYFHVLISNLASCFNFDYIYSQKYTVPMISPTSRPCDALNVKYQRYYTTIFFRRLSSNILHIRLILQT